MKSIKFIYRVVSTLGIFFLLTSCGINSLKTNDNTVDLKLKSDNKSSPLCDNIDINKNISVNKGNMDNDEIIKALMATIFDRYKNLNDPNIAIEDYTIKKIDTVLETKRGSVFGVLYSVKGNTIRTRWDANEQSDRWTTTQKIYCSYYEQRNKYILNIIGVNPLYYKGNNDKLNTEEIAKKLFENFYLSPRLLDDDKGSKLLSYSVDNVTLLKPVNNIENVFRINYSIQGVNGVCSWTFADKEGKGSSSIDIKLISLGDFYEIEGAA